MPGRRQRTIKSWWECKLEQPPWEKKWRCLKKLKIDLSYESSIPLVSVYPKEMKSAYKRDT
jgi:hypothetical protein